MPEPFIRKQDRKPKIISFEFTLPSLIMWSIAIALLMIWVFTLGIMTGEGRLPDNIKNLTEQVVSLQNIINQNQKKQNAAPEDKEAEVESYRFYDLASGKKAEPESSQEKAKPSSSSRAETAKSAAADKDSGSFVIQVAAAEEKNTADRLAQTLSDKGYPAYVYKAVINDKVYFRVRCGFYKEKEEAEKICRDLAQTEKINGIVLRLEQ